MIDPKDTPDFTNSAYNAMAPAWTLWSDVLAGQDTIKVKRETYLPKEPAELKDDYDARLARSLFFEDSRDCTVNLTGMVFRKSPTLADDVPEQLKKLTENIDNAGTHLDVFLQRVFEDGFFGHSFIVVEMPESSEDVQTAEDELGKRSYWCLKQAKDAVNFRPAIIDGETAIGQITFKECTKEPDGLFGEKEVVRYRVYMLDENQNAVWQLWEERINTENKSKEVVLIAGKGSSDKGQGAILTKSSKPLKRLPIAVHYGEHEGFLESRPPLKGIADLNVTYYQKYSDLSNIEHYTCSPTLVIIGGDDQKTTVVMGGNCLINLPIGADAKFLVVEGKSLDHLENDLEMLQKRLTSKGLDFLAGDEHRVPSTATEALLSYTQRTSKLAKMVRSLIDCTEEALSITAEMEGLEQGGSIALGVDENALTLTPDELRMYSEMNEKGQLSLHTLWGILDRADLLPDDFDEDAELALVKQAALDQMELNAKQFDAGNESTP
jgi:hypothetical protein